MMEKRKLLTFIETKKEVFPAPTHYRIALVPLLTQLGIVHRNSGVITITKLREAFCTIRGDIHNDPTTANLRFYKDMIPALKVQILLLDRPTNEGEWTIEELK